MPSSPVVERGRARGLPEGVARTGGGRASGGRSVRARARRAARVSLPLLAASLAAGGCGGGPPPKLYVLEPAPTDARERPASPAVFDALGISAVTLPGYARDARIATRDAGRRIRIDDAHRWAEDPDEAITRVLAERLRRHAGGTVLVEPWPRDFAPAARVEIDFDRLLREPAGGVDAAGQIRLLSGDGRDVLDVRPFRLTRASVSGDPSAWFEAVAALVDDLARTAVAALAEALGRPAPS